MYPTVLHVRAQLLCTGLLEILEVLKTCQAPRNICVVHACAWTNANLRHKTAITIIKTFSLIIMTDAINITIYIHANSPQNALIRGVIGWPPRLLDTIWIILTDWSCMIGDIDGLIMHDRWHWWIHVMPCVVVLLFCKGCITRHL